MSPSRPFDVGIGLGGEVVVDVDGYHPVTQGSKTVVERSGGRWAVIDGTGTHPQRLADWKTVVATMAKLSMRDRRLDPLSGPVEVAVDFRLERRGRQQWPIGGGIGDLDKLTRAILDAQTKIVWNDDVQVVRITAQKRWADTPQHVGATIAVRRICPVNTVGVNVADSHTHDNAFLADDVYRALGVVKIGPRPSSEEVFNVDGSHRDDSGREPTGRSNS